VISRALVQIFSESTLSSRLAFRGETALHKLFLNPPSRYSEDIDLVQVKPEPIGPTLTAFTQDIGFLAWSAALKTIGRKSDTSLPFRF
jgi:Nucleotidyl transferase AbiEii toxin, Type IV TA system